MIDFLRRSRAHIFVEDLSEKINVVGDDHHHLSRVLRLSTGNLITAACGGEIREYEIDEISKEKISAVATGETSQNKEPSITLVVALFKLDRLEMGISKAVESGATNIVLGLSERSSVSLDSNKKEKISRRIDSIVLNAAMQSRRSRLPKIEFVENIVSYLKDIEGEVIICDPSGTVGVPKAPVTVVIGPEGGFSKSEYEELTKSLRAWNISPYILRAETAMAVVPALICAKSL